MKLATLRDGSRDGRLIVVRGDHTSYTLAPVRTMQEALDDWATAEPMLRHAAAQLELGIAKASPWMIDALGPPLPRAFEWIDASAYLSHVRLVRKARGALPPEDLESNPLVYQGGSGHLLGPTDDLVLLDPDWGLDFESEVCVVLGDVPIGTTRAQAPSCIRLFLLANDVSLRNLIPGELAKGFGFLQSKPATAFSPLAITPDELGPAWRGGRVHLRLRTLYNGRLIGDPEAGDPMHFSFFDLIEHIAKTRAYTAGTILGSGTVSNDDPARGISCLAERRMRETLADGKPTTPFMQVGDTIQIEMLREDGRNLFGSIRQRVVGP